jgi:hypothetical protein
LDFLIEFIFSLDPLLDHIINQSGRERSYIKIKRDETGNIREGERKLGIDVLINFVKLENVIMYPLYSYTLSSFEWLNTPGIY